MAGLEQGQGLQPVGLLAVSSFESSYSIRNSLALTVIASEWPLWLSR
jgi:hypothetical protein